MMDENFEFNNTDETENKDESINENTDIVNGEDTDKVEEVVFDDEIVMSPKVEKPKKEIVKSRTMTIIESYYKQYDSYIKTNKPEKAILSLSNIVLNLLKNFEPKTCDYVIDQFKKNKKILLNKKVALQYIDLLNPTTRIKTEAFYILLTGLLDPAKKKILKIDFTKVGTFFQNQDAVNYFIKKYKIKK